MRKINISTTEHNLFKKHLKTSSLSVLLRIQALLMREKEIPIEDIGDIISRYKRTISRWFKEWEDRRISSIFSGHFGNTNSEKLTKEQRQEIKEVLQSPPSEIGLPEAFWDVPTLKNYVQTKFNVIYESDRSYHFLLKFSKLSFKYPDTFNYRRDNEKIEEKITEIRQEIKPYLEDPTWEVFACDELRIELEALTRRAWLKRGERTIVEVDHKYEFQSYIGCLNQKSFKCHMYEMPWQNQDEVLKSFEMFLSEYPEKKICVVWDNASFHRGEKIKKALKKGGLLERVHPELSPHFYPLNLSCYALQLL